MRTQGPDEAVVAARGVGDDGRRERGDTMAA
jgi:hypothetical protein